MSDPRFARLSTDPRFIRPSKASQKVVLDERFKDLLSTEGGAAAGSTSRVDKYGRKVGKDKNAKDLKAFYRLEEDTAGKGKGKQVDRARGEGLIESSDEDGSEEDEEEEENSDEQDDDDDSEDEEIMLGSKQARADDAARRKRRASSEISIDLDEDALLASTSQSVAQVEASIPTMEGSTKRIAIVNLDWDNVRAIDLYKVFDSVLSPSASSLVEGTTLGSRKSKTRIGKGRVTSVKIYPSEFGKQRMEREEKEGPPVEIFNKNRKPVTTSTSTAKASSSKKASRRKARDEDDFSEDDILQEDRGDEYDEVALRRYQLERLRYYYAIVEFDTAMASQHAYDEIDGTEFEATANVLDLRYVPEDTTFDDTPTDTATASSADMQAYKPVEFVTDALRNSKVKLTWDADDPARLKLLRGTHEGAAAAKLKGKSKSKKEEVDYSALLASDSEDDEEARKRMRSAFGFTAERGSEGEDDDEDLDTYGFGEGEADKEMEITFGPALSGNAALDDGEKDKEEETSLEAYQRKDRERRLAKKEKRKAEKKRLASGGGKSRVMHEDEEDSDPDEAFDANQMEAAGDDEDGQDAFFDIAAGDNDDDEERAEEEETELKLSKKAAKQLEREAKDKEAASLSLLVGDDDGNGSGDDGKHFDMQAILRAEKISSKPKKVLKKGKDRRKHTEAKQLLEREKDKFEVDTKDDRFKMLHENHEFALDPSNPRYMKTKNMEKLLQESRKRRSSDKPTESRPSNGSKSAPALNGQGLSSLVESIKRKSASSGAQNGEREGKKAKKQKKA